MPQVKKSCTYRHCPAHAARFSIYQYISRRSGLFAGQHRLVILEALEGVPAFMRTRLYHY
ncbi:hypothetical protein MITSMUL_03731 [Mitsuokella multacida DSM 20544]|uniref:Uncharacterized protein n=1 Tax=Mitsuokella multacida DSM 20544 TaxID=500635 RepID=C9KKN1_9FIRM|nr:hypothetical protein MITSMUL_03731 [Mitsuokella multacida DSM 20544]